MSDDFFGWLGKSLAEPLTPKKPKSMADKYIKGLDKYTGKHLTRPSLDQKMKDLLDDQAQTWITSTSGGASFSNDVEHENITVTEKLEVDGIDVGATLKTLQERFLILEEDFEKHEQYPALKDAYEKYKLIEALLKENK